MLALLRTARLGLLISLGLWAASTMLLGLTSANGFLSVAATFFLVGITSAFALPAFALACVVLQAVFYLLRRRAKRSA